MILAISTFDGHSALQDLHSRHRSRTSNVRFDVSWSTGNFPEIAALRTFARPRVVCSSSRVAMYEGHIAPMLSFRHAPTPLHISIAPANPPSLRKSMRVSIWCVLYSSPNRKLSSR